MEYISLLYIRSETQPALAKRGVFLWYGPSAIQMRPRFMSVLGILTLSTWNFYPNDVFAQGDFELKKNTFVHFA